MKTYKNIVLALCIVMEILLIIFFYLGEISANTFFLSGMSMALIIGLYFYDRNKRKNKNER